MRFAFCALVILLVVSVSLASLEPEAEQVLQSFQKRFLAELGMKDVPDMELVNTNQEEIQRMTQKYLRNVKRSEDELLASCFFLLHTGEKCYYTSSFPSEF
ncbi:hypothetical protein TNCV_3427791 [Trichonephila clavipes]|nr:hypothetical protein TNCV_3427791 [Trichonephila clavipes]